MKLNKEQKTAVRHGEGPLLIIAGAGTGKTAVITERVKHLIASDFALPGEILALTFTNKAALEMEERVDVALPYGYTQMWILTFHSFCDRILRAEALHVGLDPKFKLMSQAETVQLIRDNLFEFELDYFRPLSNPTKFVSGMLQHFSRLQDEDIAPGEYLAWVKKQKAKTGTIELAKWQELAKAFQKYEEIKTKKGIMDFGDLVTKTLFLFRQRPNILKKYQEQFKYLLVDEYQDTNIAQNELVTLLAGKLGNVTVVADDDQSIYRFRGAAVSNILQFKKTYPTAKIVTLTKNYRSQQEILDAAYGLIQNNNPDRLEAKERIDKKLASQRKGKGKISFLHLDRVENEAEAVAAEIKKLKKSTDYEWRDFAILVRANNHAEPFVRALDRQGIPHQFLGPGRLFRQSEILDLIAYLKFLTDVYDSVSLYRVLSRDHFAIAATDLAKIGSLARHQNFSLFEACERINDFPVQKKTKKKVKKILRIIRTHLKLKKKESAGQILYYFLEETGLLKNLLDPKDAAAEKKAKNIGKFFDKLKSYEVDHEDAGVEPVTAWIELSQELGESPLAADADWTGINAVNLLTVHSAKGLEFSVVFLVNLVSQRFPSRERREQIPIPEDLIKEDLPEGDYHLQEERRLFYVGTTRARDRLFLTAADYYGEAKREKKLSPFVFETLGEKVASLEKIKSGRGVSSFGFKPTSAAKTLLVESQKAFHVDYLSYSQIETFKVCPLHYKLKYLLNIPTPSSAAQSFGTSIHAALKDFYDLVKKGEKPSKKAILQALADNWINDGYKNRRHETKMRDKGEKYLTEYFKTEFLTGRIPLALEEKFVVPLSKEGERPLKIGGKIDRVDDLGKNKIEIIDYKTGANVPTQKQVDHNLQLTFYALAATKVKEPPFNKKAKEAILTLYYFDNQKKISTTRTQAELEKAEEEIFSVRNKIEKSDFTCSGHFFCSNCEYNLFCN